MKITHIKARAINIPWKAPYVWSAGGYTGVTRTIVEIGTDEGIIGYGECPSWECQEDITNNMGPKLIGMDPINIEACELRCVPEIKVLINTDTILPRMSFGGIEMALWDFRGKLWGLPLYALLGGAVRKKIPMCEYFAYRLKRGEHGGESTPAQVAAYCASMREKHGSTYFEGKLSSGNVQNDIKLIKEIRAAVGEDAMIRIDGNMAWSLSSARELVKGLEPYNIRNFEDPVDSFWEMKKLRQHTSIPFSTHNPDLRLAVELGVPDSFVLNMTVMGGIRQTISFINACEHMGHNVWCYSGDTGIGTASYLHVKAALRHMHEPSQSLFRFMEFEIVEEGPFDPVDNMLDVPEGPGLGMTLIEKNVAHGHNLFKENGPMNQYFNPANPKEYIRLPLN
jgi:glucarate dehydratase